MVTKHVPMSSAVGAKWKMVILEPVRYADLQNLVVMRLLLKKL